MDDEGLRGGSSCAPPESADDGVDQYIRQVMPYSATGVFFAVGEKHCGGGLLVDARQVGHCTNPWRWVWSGVVRVCWEVDAGDVVDGEVGARGGIRPGADDLVGDQWRQDLAELLDVVGHPCVVQFELGVGVDG